MKVAKQNQKKTKTYKLPAHNVFIYNIFNVIYFRILLFKIKRITSAQQLILIIILWYQLT